MGLCSNCPKKKVTNQFCFEHRVNVCEQCMVKDHPACVVQSYLQWLSSSDYNPVCRICDDHLGTKECVRLVCYDVFHMDCLNDWATRLPPNTAPAGYKCPACSSPVFPASNLVSPVAEHLREVLSVFPWARAGLWLPLIDGANGQTDAKEFPAVNGIISPEESGKHNTSISTAVSRKEVSAPVSQIAESHSRIQTQGVTANSSGTGTVSSSSVRITAAEDVPPTTSQFRGDVHQTSGSSVARKTSSSDTRLLLGNDLEEDSEDKYKRRTTPEGKDPDEDKYKRRSAIEWFSRWWRTMSRPSTRHHQSLIGGSRRMIILLVLLGIITILVVLSYFARGASDDDPLLDPFNNPNIRIED